jgi:signal transduction histidine kinase
MAWTEVLKENYPDDELIPEMEHDVNRLQLIAERFSKIGSVPELSTVNLLDVMNNVADYMRHRTSDKVVIEKVFPRQEVYAKINAALFEWVVENLCKNAVDAMNGSGKITLFLQDEGEHIAIEVSDTGKGIKKKDIKHVFKPGFTTKKRGWGLGLSLAKRIVE